MGLGCRVGVMLLVICPDLGGFRSAFWRIFRVLHALVL